MKRGVAALVALCAVVWIGVRGWAKLPGSSPLDGREREAIVHRLRGQPDATPLSRSIGGPVIVSVYERGAPVARAEGRGQTLGEAVEAAAAALPAGARARGRLKIDVVLAQAPLLTWPPLLATVGVVPGLDGVGVEVGGREHFLLADDLLRDDLAAAHAPAPGMEFTLGLDVPGTLDRLRADVGMDPAAFKRARKRWFRFRTDAFVEPAGGRPGALEVVRGNPPGPSLSKESLRAAAVAGGQYLLKHLQPDGRFDYEYWTARDQTVTAGYSIPRHAGGAWFLAQLYAATHEAPFLDGASRAAGWLAQATPAGCGEVVRCIGDPEATTVDLGSTALALVALSELTRASGSHEHEPWMRGLLEFVLGMQKPDGDFCHLYAPAARRRDERSKLLYYSGEAAFALARLSELPAFASDARIVPALDRALDYLTDRQYRQLALRFYFMEDHWTCMALDAGWDRLPPGSRERYARFCDQFVVFLGRTQFHAGEALVDAQPDFAGAYGFSPLLPPHGTPVGSRSETALSTLRLQTRRGLPAAVTDVTRRQILDGMRFLLAHQIRDDSAFLMADPERARGGFLMSDVARYIRIDFVQHACSAMLRAADLL